jgi:predicted dehydrogenase
MDRRYFLMTASAAAMQGAFGAPQRSPNETVRVACVGLRGRGKVHLRSYPALPNVEVAALCDVDQSVLKGAVDSLASKQSKQPAVYTDFRKLLEDRSIDAVSIATPDHQHAVQAIWACQAGKDVYVEKPCCHNMFETRQIVAASKRYNRLVQQGSQSRSSPALQEAVGKMREGLIGKVYMARALSYKHRESIGRAPIEPVPPGVDYDLWLGPAPSHPFTKNRFHYNWHWFWDYGTGDVGNQGVHEIDIARWGLGVRYPTKVSAIGGHVLFDDDQETPNLLNCAFEFDEAGGKKILIYELRNWYSNHEADIHEFTGYEDQSVKDSTVGDIFYGSNGYLAIDGYNKYQTWLGREQEPGPSAKQDGNHFANFIDAVRSRKREMLTAEIEDGSASAVLVHLANISYRLGRTLHFDAASYSCIGDAEANRMFTRDYRKPFVVPALV